MTEEPPGRSGSRWEPPIDDQLTVPETPRSWRDRVGGPVAAVAAAGVVAAVGVGGFAVGRATGEGDRPAPTSFTRDGGAGEGAIPGQGGRGAQPWSGQQGGLWDHHGDPGGQAPQDGEGLQGGPGAPDGGPVPGGAASAGPAVGT